MVSAVYVRQGGGVGEHPLRAERAVVRARTPRVRALGPTELAVEGPAAAARLPLPSVSLSSYPGSRRWQWRSTNPGETTNPETSMTVGSVPLARSASVVPSMNRSPASSRPEDGSMMRPPTRRITRRAR